jgi:hypothetical protein
MKLLSGLLSVTSSNGFRGICYGHALPGSLTKFAPSLMHLHLSGRQGSYNDGQAV